MSDALKSNTTLTQLNLSSKDKKETTHKWYQSTIQYFLFSLNQQTTTLET